MGILRIPKENSRRRNRRFLLLSCGRRIFTKSSAKATLAMASSSVPWPGVCGPGSRPSTGSQAGSRASPWRKKFGVIFQRYDSPTTVFYIDPPYFFTEDYYPGNIFLRSDHQRLAAILLNAEGLWLLSYNLCPEVLELYQQPGILIEQVDRINNMAQRYEGGAVFQEVLISNYDTEKVCQAQLYLFEPAAEGGNTMERTVSEDLRKERQSSHHPLAHPGGIGFLSG